MSGGGADALAPHEATTRRHYS